MLNLSSEYLKIEEIQIKVDKNWGKFRCQQLRLFLVSQFFLKDESFK